LSKLRVGLSFELAHVFAGPSVLVLGNQNMVTPLVYQSMEGQKSLWFH